MIDVLRNLVSHLGADFIIALAIMTIDGGKSLYVGNSLKVPDDDMG